MARISVAFPGVTAAALSFIRGTVVNPTQAETTALLAAMTVQPSADRANLINNTIFSLIGAGIWSKLDWLHVMAAHDAQAARINWKNPAQVGTVGGTCTFTADRGYQGDGTTGYIDTGLNLNALANYRQDTAHLGVWCANEATGANALLGTLTVAHASVNPRTPGNNQNMRLNNTGAFNLPNSVAKGHHVATRSLAASFDCYKNGLSIGTTVVASTGIVSNPITYFRVVGTFDNRQCAAGHGGLSLTATEISNLYNALNTYMMAVGVAP